MKGWTKGDEQEKGFLREAHIGACDHFTTVLGPGSNAFHYNHFHVDLAMHGNTSQGPRRYCRPILREPPPRPRLDDLPDPPMLEPELEMARRGGVQRNEVAQSRQPTAPLVRAATCRLRRWARPRATAAAWASTSARLPVPQRQPALASRGGMLRDDGVFVPPGEIGD